MTAPLTTRRRYANTGPQATLPVGINAAVTAFNLSTGTGFPAVPFPLILDYLGSAEEVILVTGLTGAAVTSCTRGYDGSSAQTHSGGAVCVHGIIAKDADEASQHTSSTGAHGTASAIVGLTDAQTLTNKTISSSLLKATAVDPGAKIQAVASGSAPQIQALDNAGTVTVFSVGRTGAVLVQPTDPAVVPLIAKMAASQTANGLELQSSTAAKLLVANKAGQIVQRPSDVALPAWKYVPFSDTTHFAIQVRNAADAVDQFSIDNGGAWVGSLMYVRGSFAADPIRYPLDGSLMKVDSLGNLTANNLPAVAPSKAGKRIWWGSYSGTTDTSGFMTVTHGAGFTPTVIVAVQTSVFGGGSGTGCMGANNITATTFQTRFSTISAATALSLSFVCYE